MSKKDVPEARSSSRSDKKGPASGGVCASSRIEGKSLRREDVSE